MLKRLSSRLGFRSGVTSNPGYGTASYESNTPREDRDFSKVLNDSVTTVVGVIDGHCGYRVADMMKKKVLHKIEDQMSTSTDPLGIKAIMKSTYLDCDKELLEFALINKGAYADQGACVLTAIIRPDSITVANAGDCGCLLIDSSGSTEWLNTFHNAANPSEQARLKREHPDEEDAVECIPVGKAMKTPYGALDYVCYTKGLLQPTRALGDLYLKDSRFKPDKVTQKFTPPYLTAEPELETKPRLPSHKFLVLATDGLWEQLTAADVSRLLLDSKQGSSAAELAQLLLDAALDNAAIECKLPVNILRNKPPLVSARNVIDDVTVSVVTL